MLDVVCVCLGHVHVTKDGQVVVVQLKCHVLMIVPIVGNALMEDVSVILGMLFVCLLRLLLCVVEIVC